MSDIHFRKLAALLLLTLGFSTGCSFFPEALQPHELWKLNRYKAPSSDPFFSSKEKNSLQVIPTSYDRPAVVSNRPQFHNSSKID